LASVENAGSVLLSGDAVRRRLVRRRSWSGEERRRLDSRSLESMAPFSLRVVSEADSVASVVVRPLSVNGSEVVWLTAALW